MAIMTQDDAVSTFSYDGQADPDTFSLHQLRMAVGSHFGTICSLNKLAEGGYHKVDASVFLDLVVSGNSCL